MVHALRACLTCLTRPTRAFPCLRRCVVVQKRALVSKPTFQVLVTTYQLCMQDSDFLRRFDWELCIVDEAHRLKSQTGKLYLTLLTDFTLAHKLLLTGTPVQVRQLGPGCTVQAWPLLLT